MGSELLGPGRDKVPVPMKVEEHDGREYRVYDVPEENRDSVNETWRQMMIWGHCETRWVNRPGGAVVLIPVREVGRAWAGLR